MTEHIQNKTTLLNSFLILIIPHPSPLQSLQSVVFLCVCVLRLTDIVTNVTSQSLYSRSPICYTLRDLCMHTHSHTYTHTSSLAAWCLCRSCHHPSGEQPRRVSRLFPLFFLALCLMWHLAGVYWRFSSIIVIFPFDHTAVTRTPLHTSVTHTRTCQSSGDQRGYSKIRSLFWGRTHLQTCG